MIHSTHPWEDQPAEHPNVSLSYLDLNAPPQQLHRHCVDSWCNESHYSLLPPPPSTINPVDDNRIVEDICECLCPQTQLHHPQTSSFSFSPHPSKVLEKNAHSIFATVLLFLKKLFQHGNQIVTAFWLVIFIIKAVVLWLFCDWSFCPSWVTHKIIFVEICWDHNSDFCLWDISPNLLTHFCEPRIDVFTNSTRNKGEEQYLLSCTSQSGVRIARCFLVFKYQAYLNSQGTIAKASW